MFENLREILILKTLINSSALSLLTMVLITLEAHLLIHNENSVLFQVTHTREHTPAHLQISRPCPKPSPSHEEVAELGNLKAGGKVI